MINAESELVFLNVWRPIFQMMFSFYCNRIKNSQFKVLAEIILASRHHKHTDIICEILGVQSHLVMKCKKEL